MVKSLLFCHSQGLILCRTHRGDLGTCKDIKGKLAWNLNQSWRWPWDLQSNCPGVALGSREVPVTLPCPLGQWAAHMVPVLSCTSEDCSSLPSGLLLDVISSSRREVCFCELHWTRDNPPRTWKPGGQESWGTSKKHFSFPQCLPSPKVPHLTWKKQNEDDHHLKSPQDHWPCRWEVPARMKDK